MLRNYFIIAIRNLQRNSVYSFINIAGLSLGMACTILIALWVYDEFTSDHFLPNHDRITKVWSNTWVNNEIESRGDTPPLLYKELLSYSEIKRTSLSSGPSSGLLVYGNKKVKKEGRSVSPEFLEMFPFSLMEGIPDQVLTDPLSIVITKSTAASLFGNEDPINKIIKVDNKVDVKVTGILQDLPANSSLQFDYLLTTALFEKNTDWAKDCMTDWDCDWFRVYAELQPDADLDVVNGRIKNILKGHVTLRKELFLYPLDRWQLHGEFSEGKEVTNDRSDFVASLGWLALLILVIACINFMNLSTARSERRAREVGIRKVSGSYRKQLIVQFLGESLLMTFLAFLFAMTMVQLCLPLYNTFVGKQLFIPYSSPLFWLSAFSVVLMTALLGGSYPAFFLSAFNPAKVLKGTTSLGTKGGLPRKILVIAQFTCSIVLIVATVVIYQQMHFAQSRYLGFNKENLINVPDNPELSKNYSTIKRKLIESGAAVSVTKMNSPITDIFELNYINWEGNTGGLLSFTNIFCEYDYCHTTGIKLVEGRDFSEGFASDSLSLLVNQAAVDAMGLKNPIGAVISIGDSPFTIIGVTENIVMGDPYGKVDPMYAELETEWREMSGNPNIAIRLKTTEHLKEVEAIVSKYAPSFPFEFSFVDSDFEAKFGMIYLTARLLNIFAFLAIAIASLGLLGLAAFRAEQRTKEISIRKIMGASSATIVRLLSKDYLNQVMIAILIATPVSWYLMNQWLLTHDYRIEITLWTFGFAGILATIIALLTVIPQTLKAANRNPVDSLKIE